MNLNLRLGLLVFSHESWKQIKRIFDKKLIVKTDLLEKQVCFYKH